MYSVVLVMCTRSAVSVKADDGKFGFQIDQQAAGSRSYILCADTKEERARWIYALQIAARGPPEPVPPDNARAEAAEAENETLHRNLALAMREREEYRCVAEMCVILTAALRSVRLITILLALPALTFRPPSTVHRYNSKRSRHPKPRWHAIPLSKRTPR